jgi:hypothetical protein
MHQITPNLGFFAAIELHENGGSGGEERLCQIQILFEFRD